MCSIIGCHIFAATNLVFNDNLLGHLCTATKLRELKKKKRSVCPYLSVLRSRAETARQSKISKDLPVGQAGFQNNNNSATH